MAAIYQADNWCDGCANLIRGVVRADRLHNGHKPIDESDETSYDSDQFPKYASDDDESDSPCHCAAGDTCVNAEVLESGAKVGHLFGSLTSDGIEYVRQSIVQGGEVADLWKKYYEGLGYDFELVKCPHCEKWHEND